VVNCRLQAIGRVPKAPLQELRAGSTPGDARVGSRSIYHGAAHGWVQTPVYARAKLAAGTELAGPAVIEEMSSTTLLTPGQGARVDRIGNLVIAINR
jgi:N-methylhydantoinase A